MIVHMAYEGLLIAMDMIFWGMLAQNLHIMD